MTKHHRFHPISRLQSTQSTQVFTHLYKMISDNFKGDPKTFTVESILQVPEVTQRFVQAAMFQLESQQKTIPESIDDIISALHRDVSVHLSMHDWRWQQLGRRIYAPSEALIDALMATKINAPGRLMELPQDTIYVGLPPGKFTVHNPLTHEDEVINGFYASIVHFSDGNVLSILVVGTSTHEDPDDTAIIQFSVALNDNVLEDEVQNSAVLRLNLLGVENHQHPVDVVRLLVALAFYLQTEGAELKKSTPPTEYPQLVAAKAKAMGKKGDDVLKRYRSLVRHELWNVGESFKIEKRKATIGEGAPLMVRTLVTGHFRNQAHGPGHSLRKVIWVQPFWRGEDWMPMSTSATVTYVE